MEILQIRMYCTQLPAVSIANDKSPMNSTDLKPYRKRHASPFLKKKTKTELKNKTIFSQGGTHK